MNTNETLSRFFKLDPNIQWKKDAENKIVTFKEFKDKLDYLKENGVIAKNKCHDMAWYKRNCYYLEITEREQHLYFQDASSWHLVHIWVDKLTHNGTRPHGKEGGRGAMAALQAYHQQRTGVGILADFGSVPSTLRICVPKSFYWDNVVDFPFGKHYQHMSSIDGCSQYPAGFIGILPTSYGMVEKQGTIKPSIDYPFAFYIKSGHIAVYNEFDTHDWLRQPLWEYLFKMQKYKDNPDIQQPFLPLNEDVTILMKKACNSLEEDFRHFYNIKEKYDHDSDEYKAAKLVMNAAIGMMHRNDKNNRTYDQKPWKMAHLAAVAIARANNSILKMAKKIGYKNIAQIMVDGIVYKGKPQGLDYKELGQYYQEIYDAEYYARKHGVYAFKDNTGIIKYKHVGLVTWPDGTIIEDREPTNLEDIDLWQNETNVIN